MKWKFKIAKLVVIVITCFCIVYLVGDQDKNIPINEFQQQNILSRSTESSMLNQIAVTSNLDSDDVKGEKNRLKPAHEPHAAHEPRDGHPCSSPCQNRGRCRIWKERYTCHCDEGWMGRDCEEKLDEKHKKREGLWASVVNSRSTENLSRRFPDVIGIGVEKCGTDAVISFLKHHPLVKVPEQYKETQFFNEKYERGLKYYRSLMPKVANDEILMEKTPAYFNFPPADIPDRIKAALPDVKLIAVLCDPVNRTFSDYVHEKIIGGVHAKTLYGDMVSSYLDKYRRNLTKILQKADTDGYDYIDSLHQRDKPSHIFTTGIYYYALQRWTKLFDANKLHIISGEDLISQTGVEMEKLQDFLEIPKLLLKEDFVRNKNTGFFCFNPKWSSEAKKSMKMYHHEKCLTKSKGRTRNKATNVSSETIKSLQDFYRPFNEKLFKFLNKKMNWQ
uniref:heparan sulfate glucosamine 3-O-sulfotransferase 6-like isoform X1 n=1 Tax=Styela clava TaxID=7725 RepID=UPI00193A3666|nr:heparan sulfate glucosamine 3-O-sulfotransferase 6-like isoform X1 [Styela clava]